MAGRTVYLLCFHKDGAKVRYKHAGHYLGSADDLVARLALHKAGQGARLMQVIRDAGIDFRLVRTWEGGRVLERRLKRRKNAPRLCPVCRGKGHE